MRRFCLIFAMSLTACGGGEAPVDASESLASREFPMTLGGPYDAVVQNFRGVIDQAQGAQIYYGPQSAGFTISADFAKQNMLTVVGRNPSWTLGQEDAASKGAIIAVYLDTVLHKVLGPYHEMFFNHAPECGGTNNSIPAWEGTWSSSQSAPGSDVRVSHFGSKLLCVVRRIKTDHPHIKAIFLDDYGPGWSGYLNNSDKCTARDKLGDAFQLLRNANLNLIYFVNGSWNNQRCIRNGVASGGYPVATVHGLLGALPVFERHPRSEDVPGGYLDDVTGVFGTSSQWLKDEAGRVGTFVIARTPEDADHWKRQPWAAWVAQQDTYTTSTPRPVIGASHSIGLSFGESIGITVPGDEWSGPQTANRVRSTRVTLPYAATVHSASIHLDGGGNVDGTQVFRLAIYSDLNGKPDQLRAVGKQVRVAGSSGAAWFTSELTTPISLSAGTYWIAEWTGNTPGVTRNNGKRGTGTSYYSMDNVPYSSAGSPISPFVTGSGSNLILSVFMSVQ